MPTKNILICNFNNFRDQPLLRWSRSRRDTQKDTLQISRSVELILLLRLWWWSEFQVPGHQTDWGGGWGEEIRIRKMILNWFRKVVSHVLLVTDQVHRGGDNPEIQEIISRDLQIITRRPRLFHSKRSLWLVNETNRISSLQLMMFSRELKRNKKKKKKNWIAMHFWLIDYNLENQFN